MTVYTSLKEEDIEKIDNLETVFEEIYWREKAKLDLEMVEKTQKQSKEENLNREFKENYI